MNVDSEIKGEFSITYPHQIPYFGKGKVSIENFGDNFTVAHGDTIYRVTKIKVNKKKLRIQITGLEGADKSTEKAIKKATKGSNGIPFQYNPYYVSNTDSVKIKFKNNGDIKSIKINVNGKDYKAQKDEWSYDDGLREINFKGKHLSGTYKLS